MALSNEAMESMLQAMEIIAGYKLNDVSYDRTVICKIVNNSNAKNGQYTVSDGSIKFQALSENTDYKIGEYVRVSVLNGDLTEQKYIEGKYVSENSSTPITYVSPLDSVIEMVNLTSGGTQQNLVNSLTANKYDAAHPKGIPIWTWNSSDASFKDLQANNIYNTLTVQADFKCLLTNSLMRSGSYGLRIDLEIKANSVNENVITRTLYLDSSDMFGDPYAFTIYSTQAKKFDLSEIGVIDRITVYFFQGNDFTYYDGQKTVAYPMAMVPNIFVKDISIGFGSEISQVTDNTIQLYTTDTLDFNYIMPTDDSNQKEIGFLWHNKTEDNQYVGFKDGIVNIDNDGNIIPYDEIAYLEESAEDSRLTSQLGKNIPTDVTGLKISADVEESLELIAKAQKLISRDLSNVLKAFKERLSGIPEVETLSTIIKTDLTNVEEDLEEVREGLDEYFEQALQYAAAIQADQKNGTETRLALTPPSNKNYFIKLQEIFDSVNVLLYSTDQSFARIVFQPNVLAAIQEKYQGFQGIYDTYQIRVDKIYDKLDALRLRLTHLLDGAEEEAQKYNFDTPIKDYTQIDFSQYDNRYCVYWYRYKPGYFNPDERFMEKEWERIETVPNLGLPLEYTEDSGTYYLTAKPKYSEGLLQVYLTPNMTEEKFMAVLFYNHEMFKSGELVFKNLDTIPDETTVDKSDAIYIEHGDNSMESYQTFYGPNNSLLNSADARKVRELSVHYNGLLSGDEALAGAQVYWYVPRDTTMVTVDADDLKERGFSTDYYRTARVLSTTQTYTGPKSTYDEVEQISEGEIIQVYDQSNNFYSLTKNNKIGTNGKWISGEALEFIESEYYRDGFACFYKQIRAKEIETKVEDENGNLVPVTTITCDEEDIKFFYKIQEYYDPNLLRNTIFCQVEKDEYPFETDISMIFGTQGTSGTDYTLLVAPASSRTAVTNTDNLALKVALYDYDNKRVKMYSKYKDDTSADSTNLTDLIVTDGTAFDARVSWMGPTAFSLYLKTDPEDYDVIGGEAILLREGPNYCGIAKIITSFGLGVNGEEELENGIGKQYRVVDLTTLYPVAWSAGDYYIEGASYVVYDSFGVNPSYYKNPYRIFKSNTNEEVLDVRWEIKLFTGKDGKVPSLLTSDDSEYDFCKKYMPVLNDKGGLTPANMYIDGVNCYPVVYCYQEGNDEMPLWAQPIVIIQNRYPSTMLNSWDGSLTIDEKNGTIMSAMLGAGRKTSNNTFEGVLLGDIEGGAGLDLSENKTGLGLYGFNDGSQSFGFNVDGTAFIGKSGRGRIKFDGENGTISSASYEQLKAVGDSGMKIDLDDGIIDFYGTGVKGKDENGSNLYQLGKYHPHIRLSANASKNNPYFLITTPNLSQKEEWEEKELVYIGLDDYYLQSENYVPSEFDTADGQVGTAGAGMHLNLRDGHLNAYNLSITSKNLFVDSSMDANPFFIVKDNDGCNLIFAGTDEFYLQSHSYSKNQSEPGIRINFAANDSTLVDIKGTTNSLFKVSTSEYYLQSNNFDDSTKGLKIDLKNGKITGYSFSLKGVNTSTRYGGSYIEITSNPSLTVHLKDANNSYDLDLFKISTGAFVLQSKNWSDGQTSTTTYQSATVTATTLNVRSGPGTNYNIVGSLSKGDVVKVFGSKSGWWSLSSSMNEGSGEWVSGEWVEISSVTDNENSGSGMQLDVYDGKIVMNKTNSRSLIIDVGKDTYPFQLGKLVSGKTYRNFRISWDGAVYGGSTYSWSIAANGTANFNKMNANSGTLSYMNISNATVSSVTISSGKIGGCSIDSGSISGTGWSLTANGATFNSLTVGKYKFEPISLYTNSTTISDSYPEDSYSRTRVVQGLDYTYLKDSLGGNVVDLEGNAIRVVKGETGSKYISVGSVIRYRVVGAEEK